MGVVAVLPQIRIVGARSSGCTVRLSKMIEICISCGTYRIHTFRSKKELVHCVTAVIVSQILIAESRLLC